MTKKLTLYTHPLSGNCYKVRLLLRQLAIPYKSVQIDLLKQEQRQPKFLAKNPQGKVPVLEIETGKFLRESNAILHYLSQGTDLLPTDKLNHALTLQWLFFEQCNHFPSIAKSRYIIRFLGSPPEQQETLATKKVEGYAALDIMENHLANQLFLVGDHYTIADISLYAYTHVAHEGMFDLTEYPNINSWLGRIKSQPNHIAM